MVDDQKTRLPKDQLKKLLIDHSILEGIRLGRYTEVIEDDSSSRRIPNGRSLSRFNKTASTITIPKRPLLRTPVLIPPSEFSYVGTLLFAF